MDPAEYCHEIERYLCRKNDGQIIRIFGPSFEVVCAWATRGVPLKIVYTGIDRYAERYYAKGPRRRPVQIQFCDADVLDAFDDWRRAVGVTAAATTSSGVAGDAGADGSEEPVASRRQGSLPNHLERVVARLTTLRGGEDRSLDEAIDPIVREIDNARGGARSLRGEARDMLLDRLRVLDQQLIDAARTRCDADTLRQIGAEADAELAPFRERMPRDAYDQSRRACIDRLVREHGRLPVIAFE